MAVSFVGAGGAAMAHFDLITMCPTVSSSVQSDSGAWGLVHGLLHGELLSNGEKYVSGCESRDTSCEDSYHGSE